MAPDLVLGGVVIQVKVDPNGTAVHNVGDPHTIWWHIHDVDNVSSKLQHQLEVRTTDASRAVQDERQVQLVLAFWKKCNRSSDFAIRSTNRHRRQMGGWGGNEGWEWGRNRNMKCCSRLLSWCARCIPKKCCRPKNFFRHNWVSRFRNLKLKMCHVCLSLLTFQLFILSKALHNN